MKIKITYPIAGDPDLHSEAFEIIDVETSAEYLKEEKIFLEKVNDFNNERYDDLLFERLKNVSVDEMMLIDMLKKNNKGAYIEANLIKETKREDFKKFFFSNLIKFIDNQDLPF